MRILIIRHGDPDYTIDSLTPTGWKEAELLSERLAKIKIDAFYVSPLGRAQDTASCTLKKVGAKAVTLNWLREFDPVINRPDRPHSKTSWDWLPADWTKEPRYFDRDHWSETDIMKEGHVGSTYREITDSLDELLAHHGYMREKDYYRAVRPNRSVLALFCHFGVECVLLSHLLNISPMPLWHGTCAAPSSVTSLFTEERREGIASFRMNAFGETSHLYAAGQEPSFAARFCETYDSPEERHD